MKNILFTFILPIIFSSTQGLNLPLQATSKTYDGKYYDSTQKLDFSDSTDAEIDTYYGDISNYSGTDLLNYLYTKISCSTSDIEKYYLDYGSGINGVSKWYQITDRNWSISEEISPDTFKFITSAKDSRVENTFFYNMYISDSANNDVTKAYSTLTNGYDVDKTLTKIDYINHTKPNNLIRIDKEHVWAKSHGFEVTDNNFVKGAQTDLHHLVAADGNTNSAGHNNHYYGNVDHSKAKVIYNNLADGTQEISGWLDTTTDTFEPTDEWKGDVSRCLFYMATRYSDKKDTNTKAEPYLVLTDDTSIKDDNDKCYGVQYNLSTLIDWNESDPVSQYEIHRNNLIYHNVQNNRNPYVDHPEWVRKVFAPNTESSFSGINDSYNLHIGTLKKLDLSSSHTYTFKIEDESIVEFKDNTLNPLKEGKTKITLTDEEENTKEIEIIVKGEIKTTTDFTGTSIELENNSTYNLSTKIHVENAYDSEKLKYVIENNSSITLSDNGTITTGLFPGSATIKVYLTTDDGDKLLYNLTVTSKLSNNTKILFIVGLVVILILLIVFIIIMSKMKKSKRKKIAKTAKKVYKTTKNSSKKK